MKHNTNALLRDIVDNLGETAINNMTIAQARYKLHIIEVTLQSILDTPKESDSSKTQPAPRCISCGNTNNLTEVIATPEGTYHLCPKHLAEEDIA